MVIYENVISANDLKLCDACFDEVIKYANCFLTKFIFARVDRTFIHRDWFNVASKLF